MVFAWWDPVWQHVARWLYVVSTYAQQQILWCLLHIWGIEQSAGSQNYDEKLTRTHSTCLHHAPQITLSYILLILTFVSSIFTTPLAISLMTENCSFQLTHSIQNMWKYKHQYCINENYFIHYHLCIRCEIFTEIYMYYSIMIAQCTRGCTVEVNCMRCHNLWQLGDCARPSSRAIPSSPVLAVITL